MGQLRGAMVFLIVFSQTAALAALAVVVVSIYDRGTTSRHILENVDTSTRILVDCTTPGHPCYEAGKARTGDTIAQINRIIVLVAYCTKQPGNNSVDSIERCVAVGLR